MDKNKLLLHKINEAIANGNIEFLAQCFSEDTRWNIIGISTITGKDNILRAMENHQLDPAPQVTVKTIAEDGNSLVVESTGSSARNIGSSYRASYRDVYLVEDGKIKELNTFVIDTV